MTADNQNNTGGYAEINETSDNNGGKKREIIKGEKALLILALIAAVLCDRLFFNIVLSRTGDEYGNLFYFVSIFEICVMVLFCVFNREKIYKKPLLWGVAGMIVSLCIWNFIFDYASGYGSLTFIAIPASLMMFTQIAAENPGMKNISGMIKSWFAGWFIKPFSAVARCLEVLLGTVLPGNSAKMSVLKKITAAVFITVPLAAVLTALLSGADKVFGYYVNKIFSAFNGHNLVLHGLLIAAGFLFFYSFFWNGRYGKQNESGKTAKKGYKADNLILYIILASVLTLYLLFCAVQFTYLFASAGLPDGISYSEYAREGFAQIVVISGINLIIFGSVLQYGRINKHGEKTEKDTVLKVLLYILTAVTGIMLASGFTRLGLYINTFGMTFLRLISAWFIIYLSLVLILCVVRLIYEKTPLIVCCAVLLLFCYNILGYINPDSFIVKYNISDTDVSKWTDENYSYVLYTVSDDAVNVLLEKGLDKNKYAALFEERYKAAAGKRSLASGKLKSALPEFKND